MCVKRRRPRASTVSGTLRGAVVEVDCGMSPEKSNGGCCKAVFGIDLPLHLLQGIATPIATLDKTILSSARTFLVCDSRMEDNAVRSCDMWI